MFVKQIDMAKALELAAKGMEIMESGVCESVMWMDLINARE